MSKGFRISARALRQLGAELITSDDVALNELIKNAFDARSPRVTVSIHAPADPSALALIEEQVRLNKLSIVEAMEHAEKAISPDLSIRKRSEIIEELRQYLNSPDEFADYLRSFRTQKYFIEVMDTGIGMSNENLSDRFLVIGTPNKFLKKRSAKEGEATILGDKGIGRLSMMRLGNVAKVRSKQSGSNCWNYIDFEWDRFDDPLLFLGDVDVNVQTGEMAEKSVHGTEITIHQLHAHWTAEKVHTFIQKYLRRLQDPFSKTKQPYPIDIKLNDKRQPIASIPLWLEKCAQFGAEITFNPQGVGGSKYVLRRSLTWRGSSSAETRTWSIKELTQKLEIPIEIFKRLGPFTANCLWFNRQMLAGTGIDMKLKDIKDELNNWCGGFSVYRDGFRVGQTGGMDDDWLEWDSAALKTKGFTLNRYQTVGSVSISSAANPHLVDAANRERLVSCPEQQLLKNILGDIIVNDFRSHINHTKEVETKNAIAEESTEESLRRSEESLKKTLRNVEEIGKELPKDKKYKIVEIREALQAQVEYVKTIKNALSLARETRIELLELANIGLVVEIVIHELSRLTERTGELLVELQRKKGDIDVVSVVDNLRTQITATNKRIRSVDAMSPSGRHHKERYDAVAQTKSIAAGFKNRFKRHEIECTVTLDEGEPDKPLEVRMVRGLIAQALENLLANSVYWLQQGLKEGEEQRSIHIDIDSKALTVNVTDNGPGIEPKYSKDIFKPYHTTRKKGKGLGLFIASELVEYHGGRLYLDEMADTDGRLRTFIIELPREGE
jgi:signal transduction histidine kinase